MIGRLLLRMQQGWKRRFLSIPRLEEVPPWHSRERTASVRPQKVRSLRFADEMAEMASEYECRTVLGGAGRH